MKILYLGFVVTDDILKDIIQKERKQPQIAAIKLQLNIINGIEKISKITMDIISSIPVSDYPGYPKIFFNGSEWCHKDGADDIFLPFINIILFKHISRFFFALLYIAKWLFKYKRNPERILLIYAMHSPYIAASLLASRVFGGRTILVIPDIPEFMDVGNKNVFRRLFKFIDSWLLFSMIKNIDGFIVLARSMVERLKIENSSFIVMEGAISADLGNNGENKFIQNEITTASEKIIMYAGGLKYDYGLDLILRAFALLEEEDYRLWICGKGEMETIICEAGKKDKRIIYLGLLSNEEVVMKERQSNVLLNVRSTKSPFTKYSFPSKLLEYMMTGRPIISTPLLGIPEEYMKYLYILQNETPEDLAELIRKVCLKSPKELHEFGLCARKFVVEKKNYIRQGERIYKFMQKILKT